MLRNAIFAGANCQSVHLKVKQNNNEILSDQKDD